jgi:hypothetical protein
MQDLHTVFFFFLFSFLLLTDTWLLSSRIGQHTQAPRAITTSTIIQNIINLVS